MKPPELVFPNTKVSTDSATQTITVKNEGSAATTNFANPRITGPFAFSGCTTDLNTGQSCDVTITFHPTATGAAVGKFTMDYEGGTLSTSLRGTGKAN